MISVVVLTKNEEKNLEKCLKALLWCDEILVIDDNSNDKTVQIAKKFDVKVFQQTLQDFSLQRNFGLEKAQGEWILFIDADELVSKDLKEEIQKIIKNTKKYDGFYLKRVDELWKKILLHGEIGNIRLLRLGRKEKGKWRGRVHEVWEINGRIGELKNKLIHYPHQSIEEFLKEINSYTDLRAKELHEMGIKTSFGQIVFYPIGKFVVNYLLKGGFLDGLEGFIFAIVMSSHSFLVRGKLWLLWQKK